MRHYEIVFLVHPDQEQQLDALLDRYRTIIRQAGGKVHRFENWGRRQLAYPIKKLYRAHYILMNIECGQTELDELEHNFRINDAVLRHLTLQCQKAITQPSVMTKAAAPAAGDARSSRQRPARAPQAAVRDQAADRAEPAAADNKPADEEA